MKKIYVSIISRHQGHWAMFTAFQNAAAVAIQAGYAPMLAPYVGDSLVSRARNNALGHFLKTDADYFFILDDDIAIPPHTLTTLIEANKDMIGGFYRLKKEIPKDIEWHLADMIAFRTREEFSFNKNRPVEVQYISTGCVMHTRKFIEEMVAHYPDLHYLENSTGDDRYALYQPFVHKQEYLSEDWAFCQRALDKGYKLYMHTGIQCDHWGLRKFEFGEVLR